MQPQAKTTSKTTRWTSDGAHSAATFQVRHMMVSTVRGVFRPVNAVLDYDAENPAASHISVRIPVEGVDTKEEKRDAHLRSPDFFDADHFPEITFESKTIDRSGEDRLAVTGDLTIRDVTREVTLEVEATGEAKNPMNGKLTRGYEVRTAIDRKDFGLTWNAALETGGVLVGDRVKITVDLELVIDE